MKVELQEIVVSADYTSRKWTEKADETDESDEYENEDDWLPIEGDDKVKKLILSDIFWKKVVDALRIMSPLVKFLRLTDGDQPAMGKVYDRMFAIGQKIEKSNVVWKKSAARIHADRWEYLHSFMHSAGYGLDPEFMHLQSEIDVATQNGLMDIIEKISIRDIIAESEDPKAMLQSLYSSEADDPESVAILPDDLKEKAEERAMETHIELAKYQACQGPFSSSVVQKAAKVMTPSDWWSTYGKHVPKLQSVARRVLVQPVSASACERNWSVYGQIMRPTRNRLSHGRADKLVYCHEALHMHAKLRSASYEQQPAQWGSESDSDTAETDEEDLAM